MHRFLFSTVVALLLCSSLLRPVPWVSVGLAGLVNQEADILLADFEGKDYGDWKTTGTAFGTGPARGKLPGQMPVSGFQGKGLVNTFLDGDRSTGTLTSPEFKLERHYLTFLLGGGKDPAKLALQLLVDGEVVRSATGPNDRPGGSEELAPGFWDVSAFAGKMAVVRIVDQAIGPWGHINVDKLVLTNRKPAVEVHEAKRDFQVEKRYLLLPIRNGAKRRGVTLLVEGRPVVRNDIELADDRPDWWAPLEVSRWKGQRVTLVVDRLREDSGALKNIEPSDQLKGADTLYQESLRGQLHFSPRRGWNNDPNGLVYFRGEYHLFFQHNPYGWGWGNMHWGHAVSKDLVHWEELGEALLPDERGAMFSGSAVVDHANTSGFGKEGQPPLVLLYTAAGHPTTQCLAYSTDGRTFTRYEKNPVVPQLTPGNRDPKVFWHAASKHWVMVLYVEWKGKHTVHFFRSPNLKDWTLASVLEGGTPGKDGYLFECPDLFELPVDGDPQKQRWVLLGANTEYAVGSFDGSRFSPEQTKLPGQRGKGFYAPQTFNDLPAKDGRRIQLGWFQTATPGMPFNQSMSLPLEVKLTQTSAGPRLTWTPVQELAALRARTHSLEPLTLQPDTPNPLAALKAELVELRAELEPAEGSEVLFTIRGVRVSYDTRTQQLHVNGQRAPAPLKDGRLSLTVYCDRTGLEVFAADGLTYVPLPFNADPADRSLALQARGGPVRVRSLVVHELRSVWQSH